MDKNQGSSRNSGFDWLSLDDKEEILWFGQPRTKSIIPSVLIGIILIPFALRSISYSWSISTS